MSISANNEVHQHDVFCLSQYIYVFHRVKSYDRARQFFYDVKHESRIERVKIAADYYKHDNFYIHRLTIDAKISKYILVLRVSMLVYRSYSSAQFRKIE